MNGVKILIFNLFIIPNSIIRFKSKYLAWVKILRDVYYTITFCSIFITNFCKVFNMYFLLTTCKGISYY